MIPIEHLSEVADPERLQTWLDAQLPEFGTGNLTVTPLQGGTSNLILKLGRAGQVAILRRPPPKAPPGGEQTILREARVLRALAETSAPHPRLLTACEDPSVIGSPFYVMAYVDGWSGEVKTQGMRCPPPFDRAPDAAQVPFAVVEALAALAQVDHHSVGLGEFGRPEGFLARQVDRWLGQLRSYRERYGYAGRHIPGLDYVSEWLRERPPKPAAPGIMHGDVGLQNVMFSRDPPARVLALVDWELCTVGDPLLDLGHFAQGLRDEREPDRTPAHSALPAELYPTRQVLARRYGVLTGRAVDGLDYYVVLAMFKNACIVEYKVAQAAIGLLPPETGRVFADAVIRRMAEAERLARRSSWKG
jgi:aminoglycoside phosphotransferase (APT) family kinase protein